MKKSFYLFALVFILGLAGLVEAVTGYILWFALPSGAGRRGLESLYWGLSRHTWIDLHDWAAVMLTFVVLVHLVLHWKWIVRMVRHVIGQMNGVLKLKKA
jgi:cytochrome b subunit of formate dehydrogenase